ncbi:hypothetical protein [Methylorubrum extorquens]|uniref:Uncharacterized protein n=1 Tax=Methylorubrum extorquens (strain CM4 / NCIMB 13688) TaxID=440085 RepID=B7L3S1_METC4|nr:hypothetical protein [Methylorubrum extorquens]ACK86479.1 hypothetical protein Mchl_5768 [Methylorubrum extorquens CM4]
MTLAALHRRLERIERREGMHGDLEQMSDAQLWRIIRRDYSALAREHGSLLAAIQHLRATGETALAGLIEEDTGGADAVRH